MDPVQGGARDLLSPALGGADERDRYLDAFARVIRRHGLSRTRVRDVAEEVGVSRVTVYRQVGTVREMTMLLLDREWRRLLPDVTGWASKARSKRFAEERRPKYSPRGVEPNCFSLSPRHGTIRARYALEECLVPMPLGAGWRGGVGIGLQ